MNNVTLVTMFYDIGRSSWDKRFTRKVDEYFEAFKTFLNYDYVMIVFIDDRYIDKLSIIVGDNKNVTLIPINESWLKLNSLSWSKLDKERDIMNSDSYKNLVSHRIAANYPENTIPEYTILTHSKIDIVNYVIDSNLSNSQYLAWVDFGYFHHKTSEDFLPNGVLDLNKFNLDKINLCLINPIDDNDVNLQYTLQVAPEKIGAYFFFGSKEKLKEFHTQCHLMLDEFQKNNIADDEQCLWLYILLSKPHLFQCYVFGAWHRALKYFSID